MKATVCNVALLLTTMKLRYMRPTLVVELQFIVSTIPLAPILLLTVLNSNEELFGEAPSFEYRSKPFRKTATLESTSFQGSRKGMTHVSDLCQSSEIREFGSRLQVKARMSSLTSARKQKPSLVQLTALWSILTKKVRLLLFWLFKYLTENRKLGEQLDWKSLIEIATDGAFRKGIGSMQLQEQKSSPAKMMVEGLAGSKTPRETWAVNMSDGRQELGQAGSWAQQRASRQVKRSPFFILVFTERVISFNLKATANQQIGI